MSWSARQRGQPPSDGARSRQCPSARPVAAALDARCNLARASAGAPLHHFRRLNRTPQAVTRAAASPSQSIHSSAQRCEAGKAPASRLAPASWETSCPQTRRALPWTAGSPDHAAAAARRLAIGSPARRCKHWPQHSREALLDSADASREILPSHHRLLGASGCVARRATTQGAPRWCAAAADTRTAGSR